MRYFSIILILLGNGVFSFRLKIIKINKFLIKSFFKSDKKCYNCLCDIYNQKLFISEIRIGKFISSPEKQIFYRKEKYISGFTRRL